MMFLTIVVYALLIGSGAYLGYQFGRLRMLRRETRDAYRRGKVDGLRTAAALLESYHAEREPEGGESC